jgi:hypothetical protein
MPHMNTKAPNGVPIRQNSKALAQIDGRCKSQDKRTSVM